ncbi:peptidylprolyl isomerase [Permianibacter sp. IMCC34836]|uniref:peptidylprolyl isomerase n=1 Tax=Permianibacter fluminis TaxID=2738515 RepID=UPI0015516D1C|nr:peptidylprolyl isomerase [Permianibacter fluminis]NQD36468.1 peptidylprolyl isomerase [Permianibacter fluminis]
MQIADQKVVSIHYTLRDKAGNVLDSSEGNQPLAFIQGRGNIIPGLESAMDGKAVGDKFDAVIPAAEAYGERIEELVQVLPRSMFSGIDDIMVGMQFQATGGTGPVVITVTDIDGDQITVDGNHELAGVELHFAVEVVDVRDASAEELAHGHVHGAGGHHHHDDEEEDGEHCCGGGCH